jgi:hypothetical protein
MQPSKPQRGSRLFSCHGSVVFSLTAGTGGVRSEAAFQGKSLSSSRLRNVTRLSLAMLAVLCSVQRPRWRVTPASPPAAADSPPPRQPAWPLPVDVIASVFVAALVIGNEIVDVIDHAQAVAANSCARRGRDGTSGAAAAAATTLLPRCRCCHDAAAAVPLLPRCRCCHDAAAAVPLLPRRRRRQRQRARTVPSPYERIRAARRPGAPFSVCRLLSVREHRIN